MEEHIKKTDTVHKVLAHSYSLYLGALLLGLLLDFMFPQVLFSAPMAANIGAICLGFASGLIFWAQRTNRDLDISNLSRDTFARGPYKISRTPTHWGLFLLMIGFGIISNGLFVIVLSFVSFILTKYIFIKKEEDILAEKYGTPYLEYKKSVKL